MKSIALATVLACLSISFAAYAKTESQKTTDPTIAASSKHLPIVLAQSSGATCTYEGRSYQPGAQICRAGEKHQCTKNGEWVNLRQKC